ncbi:MAG: hypothetical protein H6844_19295 [Alphaproteobacteria bacterium]|nr:hypothetical protein [Alphaproteobacteria bacterium]
MPRIDHLIKTCRAHGREDGEPVRAAIARLQAARSEAVSGVNAALAAFEAQFPNLDLLLDEEGDSDGTQ